MRFTLLIPILKNPFPLVSRAAVSRVFFVRHHPQGFHEACPLLLPTSTANYLTLVLSVAPSFRNKSG